MRRLPTLPFCVLVLLGYAQSLQAQAVTDTLTVQQGAEIGYQARQLIGELEDLLNVIANADVGSKQVQDLIRNSYTTSRNQIFYDARVTIEEDVDPQANANNYKDVSVDKYLGMMDLYYEKSQEPSVSFSELKLSEVKKKDYYYVRVAFERMFENQHKQIGMPYQPEARIAEVRADKVGNKWQTRIVGLSFRRADDNIEDAAHNVILVTDNEGVAEGEQPADPAEASQRTALLYERLVQELSRRGQEELQEKNRTYDQSVQRGEQAFAQEQYDAAQAHFEDADRVFGNRSLPKVRLTEIEKARDQKNAFAAAIETASKARKFRQYEKALRAYDEAIRLRPDDRQLREERNAVTALYSVTAGPRNKMAVRDYSGALKDCNQLIKDQKDNARQFPELFMLRGECYLQEGKNKAAEKDFETALEYDPQYLAAYLARARLREQSKSYADALADYDRAIQIDPSEDAPYARRGAIRKLTNQLENALSDYQEAARLSPLTADYAFQKGKLQYQLKKYSAAQASFADAIRHDDKLTEALYWRGLAYLRQAKVAEAAADFSQARQRNLRDDLVGSIRAEADGLYQLGQQAYEKQKYAEAIEHFTNALAIWPEHQSAHLALGDGYWYLPDAEASLNTYSKLLEKYPGYAPAFLHRGQAYLKQTRYSRAIEDFTQAQRLDRQQPEAFIGKGDAHMALSEFPAAQGEYRQAITIFEAQVKSNKNDRKAAAQLTDARLRTARALYAQDKFKEAKAETDEVLRADKNSAPAYFERGRIYHAQKDYKKALADYQQANKLKYDPVAVAYAQAQTRYEHKDFAGAARDYTTVLAASRAADYPDALLLRAQSYQAQNQADATLSDLRTYAERYPDRLDSRFHTQRGFALLDARRPDEALLSFEEAVRIKGSYGPALFGKGCALATLGRSDEAMTWLRQAYPANDLSNDLIKQMEPRHLSSLVKNKAYRRLKKDYKR